MDSHTPPPRQRRTCSHGRVPGPAPANRHREGADKKATGMSTVTEQAPVEGETVESRRRRKPFRNGKCLRGRACEQWILPTDTGSAVSVHWRFLSVGDKLGEPKSEESSISDRPRTTYRLRSQWHLAGAWGCGSRALQLVSLLEGSKPRPSLHVIDIWLGEPRLQLG